MRPRTALIIGALIVGVFALPAATAVGQTATQTYIVQMLDEPAVAYDGGVAGIPATKPGKGNKIDPSSQNVKRYQAHLEEKHDKALSNVGGGDVVYDYGISFNGFAVRLTEAQAAAMKIEKGVVAVTPDELRTMDTSSTPAFLGLTANGGLWDQLGGVSKGGLNKGAGEDIIIGIIDSGIWPESKSFSDRKLDGSSGNNYPHKITGFHGTCQAGEEFTTANCNDKLIGARYFNAGQGGDAGINASRPWEFNSPRDYNGHGTHTASTSGGNFGVTTTGPASVFGEISGIAPRARISAYKALWSTQSGDTASGTLSDLVAAIDTAVADGVDVINYSISGTTTNFLDPAEIAFFFAADAGVFVSASAGNSGPATGTVAHPSPWITTVAAGTHNRNGRGSVTLGDGSTISGASVASAIGPRPFIDSTAAGLAGADPTRVALCYTAADNGGTPVLDPAKIAGKIVLCDRGVTARVNKSLAVQQAGGVGMVLANTSANSLNADLHFVPSVHISHLDRPAVKAYAATVGATATINQSTVVFNEPAPFTAAFSSRGPLTAGAGDLLKPDVIAPGQDVLAAVAKTPAQANLDFNVLSGTSMSAPHVAGLAALLKQLHPNWSPMAVKSALMTSGTDVLDGPNTDPAVIFRQGAGHVRPNSAADPGLVFDSGFNDWAAFLCGTTTGFVPASFCTALDGAGFSLDPSDFNVPSISIGDLPGSQTVTRTVTNVSGRAESYTASVTGLTGLTAAVSAIGSVGAGATKSFTVTLTRTTATLGTYAGGQLTLTGDRGHVVRIPLVIRPVAIAAPREVTFNTSTGPSSWEVKTGYEGTLNATVRGLVPATEVPYTVAQDPDENWTTCGDTQGTFVRNTIIPAGTTHFRVGVYEDAITPSGTDLDLFVCQGSTLVGVSADGDSNEEVNFTSTNGFAGNIAITVYVHGFDTVDASATGTLFEWAVGTASAGNTTLAITPPGQTTIGGTKTVTASFTGLAADTRYMGVVRYNDGTNQIGSTVLRVNTP
jgi:subtilisin family serine protease